MRHDGSARNLWRLSIMYPRDTWGIKVQVARRASRQLRLMSLNQFLAVASLC